MIALFTTPHGTFISINLLGDSIRSTLWQWGKPRGHKLYATCYEAVLECVVSGFVLATPTVKDMFEMDVLMGDK